MMWKIRREADRKLNDRAEHTRGPPPAR
ncbi:hypothetical protein FRAHR75_1570005 [Frankia sp. Hr75.2]|nr:hypothetical protein FRAHR75_1570005 [Frankia sp. Hr75.2]SQE00511.1 hypothetical protein FMEAI12_6680012 [Parafrankia sp. Ea1.12]